MLDEELPLWVADRAGHSIALEQAVKTSGIPDLKRIMRTGTVVIDRRNW
jgi:hypothetical protein